MKLTYFHGFGSKFDTSSPKIKTLSKLGHVNGYTIDYTQPAPEIIKQAATFVSENKSQLVVGTSMGGWLANQVGNLLNIPFVMINPAYSPSLNLLKHVGTHIDFTGKEYTLKKETVLTYPDLMLSGEGLLLLDLGDDYLFKNADEVNSFANKMGKFFTVCTFEGGSHRFEHMEEALNEIDLHYEMCNYSIGIEDFS